MEDEEAGTKSESLSDELKGTRDALRELRIEVQRLDAQINNAHGALDVLGTPRTVTVKNTWGDSTQTLTIEARLLSYFLNGG